MNPIILIVDDSKHVRSSLCNWLSYVLPGFRFLETDNGEEAVALVRVDRPWLVLMDVRMKKMSGIEATRHIREAVPQTQVIMLSMYDAREYVEGAAKAGAAGYVLKSRAHKDLIPLIERLLFEMPAEDGLGSCFPTHPPSTA